MYKKCVYHSHVLYMAMIYALLVHVAYYFEYYLLDPCTFVYNNSSWLQVAVNQEMLLFTFSIIIIIITATAIILALSAVVSATNRQRI